MMDSVGSIIYGNGACGKDVDERIITTCSQWRELPGYIDDKKGYQKLKKTLQNSSSHLR